MSLIHDARVSLTAINTWMGVIQANLEGTRSTAYKTNRVSFTSNNNIGPSGTNLSSRPGSTNGNSVLPSASLLISQTMTNFEQGELIATDALFDTAINGAGFFLLADTLEPHHRNYFVSRDGQFHLDAEGYLVNKDGLYVMDTLAVLGNSQNQQPIPVYTEPGQPGEWECRDRLRVSNTSPLVAPAGSYITLTIDAQSMIDQGMLQPDLDDLRITYWNGFSYQTLPINIDTTLGMDQVIITFQTVAPIGVGGFDDNYFMQYCNPQAGPGPQIPSLTYFDPYDNGVINTPVGTYVSGGAGGVWEEGNATNGAGNATVGAVGGVGACGIGNLAARITIDNDFELLQRFDGAGENRMVLDTTPTSNPHTWTDYRVSVKAGTLTHNNGGVMVLFRWDEATQTGYRFIQTAGGSLNDPNAPAGPRASRRIEKVVAGVVQSPPLFEDTFLPPSTVAFDFAHPTDYSDGFTIHVWETDIDVEVRSNNIIIYQGGVPFFNFTDNTAPILQGTVGVGTFNQAAYFDNLRVEPLPLGNAAVIGSNGGVNVGGLFGGNPGSSEWQSWIEQNLMLVRPNNEQGLIYSQYGSTVFDLQKSVYGMLSTGTSGTQGMGITKSKHFEASNASFTEFLPMLSSAQKMFAAISKLISIANGQLDEVNQLVR